MNKNYNKENFEQLKKGKVLIEFYANWCGPCQMLNEILEKINDIDIIKIDVDKHQKLAKEYGVMTIPCLILLNKGKEEKRNIGFINEDKLKEFIK